jgi:hypothetical protein
LWQNTSGALSVWDMSGNQTSFGSMTSDWFVAAIADFGGDSKSDILWRKLDGSISLSITNGSQVSIGSHSNDWHIIGAGDFDGDSDNDILWRNDSGAIQTWDIDGTRGPALWVPTYWQFMGVGYYDTDNLADILWRHQNGAVVTTSIYGTHTLIGNASSDWAIATESTGSSTPVGGSPLASGDNRLPVSDIEDSSDNDLLPHNFPEYIGGPTNHDKYGFML